MPEMQTNRSPNGAEETRAVARLPGLDIAIIHTAAHGGKGESVAVMLQKTEMPPMPVFDPIRLWAQTVEAAWAPWLAITSVLWGMPRLPDGK
jgi:hypothetical protein